MAAVTTNPSDPAAKQKQPEPLPGVCVGDEVFVKHAKGPCSGKVVAHGAHGAHVEIGGMVHKVGWKYVLAHKTRAAQSYEVVEDGEDGMIVQDADGNRHFIGIPPEAREGKMMMKSLDGGQRLILLKAAGGAPYMGAPGLTKKTVMDRRGFQTTRWVSTRPDGPPAQRGQHVGFVNGEHKGHGKVIADPGQHGVTVKDHAGGIHRVPHEAVSHHWEGGGEPTASPHQPEPGAQTAESVTGPKIDDKWNEFSKESGTLGIPRRDMPQFRGEYTDELVSFLKGVGIDSKKTTVDPSRLKASQREFAPEKVEEARTRGGADRPMMISSDGYIMDRHHQWVAGLQDRRSSMPAVVFDAPIKELLDAVHKFPKLDKSPQGAATVSDMNKPEKDIVLPIDPKASPEQKLAAIAKLTTENQPIVDKFLKEIDDALGTKSGSSVKMPDKILAKAKRPIILATKPWHDIEHIRDTFRSKTVINSVADVEHIFAKLKELGATMVKVDMNKLQDPKEWGWRIIAFDMRMPNGQLVEYYMPLKELEAAKKAGGGHKLFEDGRDVDPMKASPEELKHLADLQQQSRDLYTGAYKAYQARTGSNKASDRASLDKVSAMAASLTSDQSSSKSPMVKGGAGFHDPFTRSIDSLSAGLNTSTLSLSSSSVKTRSPVLILISSNKR